ncbi:MAG: D-alanyl-D-alanine carboxypeptidase [Spartobacteria bacterium]|nr:D-alanyl-D-alanine carboxypeptidase [Spartobacteria bacterium]
MFTRSTTSFFAFAAVALLACSASAALETISQDPYIGAVVIDADTGSVLQEDNAHTVAYPASMIKMMDALIVLERIQSGHLRLDETVRITAEAAGMGGSQVYLKEGETFTIDELLYALMIQSANDAAVALAIHVAGSRNAFEAMMQQKADELGMKDTHIHSVHGLPPGKGQKPDVSTPYDMALLGQALTKMPDIYRYTSIQEKGFRDNTFIMRTHNNLLKSYEGCDGFKTGYFRAGGFSITATAARNDRRVIAVVMGSKQKKVRDQSAKEFLSAGFMNLPAIVPTPTPVPIMHAVTTEEIPLIDVVTIEEKPEPSRGLWWKIPLFMFIAGSLAAFFISRRRKC